MKHLDGPFTRNVLPYFLRKFFKKIKVPSAAIVISALRTHARVFCLSIFSFALGQLMPWLAVYHLLLAFHVFDISSRTMSWIELNLSGRHCGNMEIQNC